MHEMGSVWELDRTLAQTLLAESARLHLIIGEDFTKSLIALRTDLEASCEVLLSDIVRTLNLHPDDPASLQVKATPPKVPVSHLTEGKPAPDGAGGSPGRHGGLPAQPPQRNKFSNRDLRTN